MGYLKWFSGITVGLVLKRKIKNIITYAIAQHKASFIYHPEWTIDCQL